MKRSGFTLIELIFVIVIIGVLSAVAIPKFSNLKLNAEVSNMVKPVAQVIENGKSAYLNDLELNGVTPTLTTMFDFKGKGWTGAADAYTWTATNGDNLVVSNSAGTVSITINDVATGTQAAYLRTQVSAKTGITFADGVAQTFVLAQ
jgi:prepilin-type N-terminal cleavage/methylation domain-containing protein